MERSSSADDLPGLGADAASWSAQTDDNHNSVLRRFDDSDKVDVLPYACLFDCNDHHSSSWLFGWLGACWYHTDDGHTCCTRLYMGKVTNWFRQANGSPWQYHPWSCHCANVILEKKHIHRKATLPVNKHTTALLFLHSLPNIKTQTPTFCQVIVYSHLPMDGQCGNMIYQLFWPSMGFM